MNIESANLSSLAPSLGTVDSIAQPLTGSGTVSEAFSGELVAQIGLLSNAKTGGASPVQTPVNTGLPIINSLQGVAAVPVGNVDTQNIAALLGNDLPPSYQINSHVDHEAVLGTVTDTLKYIGMSATTAEKAAAAEQNIKNVIAMAVPGGQAGKSAAALGTATEQNIKDTIAAVLPAGQQSSKDAAAAVLVGQNSKDAAATAAVPVAQSNKNAAAAVLVGQSKTDAAATAAIPVAQSNKNAVAAVLVGQSNKDTAATVAVPAGQSSKNTAAAVLVGQNSKDATAAAALVGQNSKDTAATAAVPAGQSNKNAAAAVLVGQSNKNAAVAAAPLGQTGKNAATAVPTGQNSKDAIATAALAGQNRKHVFADLVPTEKNIKNAVAVAVQTGQSDKGGIAAAAMAVPSKQAIKDVIAAVVPAEKNSKDAMAMTASVKQTVQDPITTVTPTGQNNQDLPVTLVSPVQSGENTAATAVPLQQKPTGVGAEAEQDMNNMKEAIAAVVTAQMDVKPAKNDKSDKKQVEGEAQTVVAENNHAAEGVSATMIIPAALPAEPAKSVNNLAQADSPKEDDLLSFIKPSTENAKPNQPTKAPDDGPLHNTTAFRQPVQDNQNFSLKSVDNAVNTGVAEKSARIEQQALSAEGEKALPRVGTDLAQPNKLVAETKADVPAITKPLSHPEWNKDLGERIVWMSSKAIPTAEIRLNPPHLGPISVRVDVADDQATVVFTAQHAATRDAIEASIPKLKEMMGAQQLNLADVNISQGSMSDQGRSQAQNFAQTADGRGQQGGAANVAANGVDEIEQEIESGRAVVSNGLLSIYA